MFDIGSCLVTGNIYKWQFVSSPHSQIYNGLHGNHDYMDIPVAGRMLVCMCIE